MKETIEDKIKAILKDEYERTGVRVDSVSVEWLLNVNGDVLFMNISMSTEKSV